MGYQNMRDIKDIVINNIYLCALDKENNVAILPEEELQLDETTYEYFERHVLKGIACDDAVTRKFDGEPNIVKNLCQEIFDNNSTFTINSRKMAQYLYKCMQSDECSKAGDFAVCLFEDQNGYYIAMLKLDYTNTYSHYLDSGNHGTSVKLAENSTGLPSMGQRVQKAVFIKPYDEASEYDMLMVDNKPSEYFTSAFVKCSLFRDNRENTKIIQKVSENFARKAFKDNAEEAEKFRKNLSEVLTQQDNVRLEHIVENACMQSERPDLKIEYISALQAEGFKDEKIPVDREWAEKKLKKKRLKIDKDIELSIDLEAYNDKDRFEIIRNGDGTINILLKCIKNYIEK